VQDVFRRPADPQVAECLGVENVLPAEIVERDSGLVTVQVGAHRMQAIDAGDAGPVFACIHAEDVSLSREESQTSSIRNRLPGRVRSVIPEGPLARVELDCGFPLVAVITAQSAAELRLQADDTIWAVIKATAVHLASASAA
jgi:molybdate transport system ATP-binding protein